jgi:ClpP class serine protease
MKNKELLSEEISQMKYLFGYKKGMVISEQVTEPTDMSSDELKSQNQDLKNLVDLERKKLMSTRGQNLRTIVDDKKETIAQFIDKVKEFIDNEKEDISTFAENAVGTAGEIVNSINDKIEQAKTKLGDKIEDVKVQRQIKKAEELKRKFAELNVKTKELEMTGRVLTDEDKRKAKRALLILLIDIIAAFSFFTFAPALVPLAPSIIP